MCTFHPLFGYEDFVEGYRPVLVDGRMAFEHRDGIFKRLCKDALGEPEKRFYLIIDEINRGDIPRIFGELLTVLEKDKRGTSLLLGLSGESFTVPGNVFVIGTMNTADRSIALLDAALRRRFGFIELMPDGKLLGNAGVSGIPLGPWLDKLNERVREHAGRDARNLQIGHSYLLENGHPISTFARFSQVLRHDIIPLLEEYTYEDYSALEKILGSGLVDTRGQRIRDEYFEPAREPDLVRALLETSPEVETTPQAVASELEAEAGEREDEQEEPPEASA
jgi:5-methylcytosine-specific restriction protein B